MALMDFSKCNWSQWIKFWACNAAAVQPFGCYSMLYWPHNLPPSLGVGATALDPAASNVGTAHVQRWITGSF